MATGIVDEVSVYEDIACEHGVIGCCLIDRDAIPVALKVMQPDDMFRVWHRFLFGVMADLWQRREPCDLITVVSEVKRRLAAIEHMPAKEKREASLAMSLPDAWESYLSECICSVPHALHVEFYARRVADMASRRRIDRELSDLATDNALLDDSVDGAIDEATKRLRDARGVTTAGTLTYIGDMADDATYGVLPNVKIGGPFSWLDKLTGGFEPGQLVIVAARPSVGKSAVVIQWLVEIADQQHKPTALISLEMPRRDVMNRVMAMRSGVNMHTFRSGGQVSIEEHRRIKAARESLATIPFAVDDDPDTTLRGVLARARHAIESQRIAILGIDYLQLIHDPRKGENRNTEVGRISASLKQLAREYQVPVILLAQLNRGVEVRLDSEPQLSDLRDSGEIEQNADIVVMLHRTDEFGAVKLLVRKNRNGPTGFLPLRFQKETASFTGEA